MPFYLRYNSECTEGPFVSELGSFERALLVLANGAPQVDILQDTKPVFRLRAPGTCEVLSQGYYREIVRPWGYTDFAKRVSDVLGVPAELVKQGEEVS